jgi:pimeloyl-ACP methyl ester carboxylesterase
MHNKTYILLGCAVFSAALFFFDVRMVYADTIIGETLIVEDTTWDKTKSPYILEGDVTVADGSTLTIKEGVEVRGMTDADDYTPGIYVEGSRLIVQGKKSSPVTFDTVGRISIDSGYAEISKAEIKNGGGISAEGSLVHIATSSIHNTEQAIRAKDSLIVIEDSKIENNTYGIRVEPHQIFQVNAFREYNGFAPAGIAGIGGIGNALTAVLLASSSAEVRHSIIAGNARTSVENFADFSVDADGNWWGSVEGPRTTGANRIVGEVEYNPALREEPDLTPADDPIEDTCCSSILFIPGLMATRLYDSSEQLWEPHNNNDVRQLFLDEQGSSTDPSIYAGLPMQTAYGIALDVYSSLMKLFGSLRREGTISDWSVFGYDWRMPVAEVVAGQAIHRTFMNGIEGATTTESLVELVEELALHSKTSKVSLIAHSNGGLVAKYLVKTLADAGKESLIDSVISVAVPYLGTPEAVAALLHGHGQEIGAGLLLSADVARALGKNMASAYSLLPSQKYFSRVFSPTIAFASTTVEGINPGLYPQQIATALDQKSFILDELNGRTEPVSTDVAHALEGNQFLQVSADVLHSVIDPFKWPETISRWAIVGWNKLTTKGIEYDNKKICIRHTVSMECKNDVVHTEQNTRLGDGTVVSPSAAYEGGNIISVDLEKESSAAHKNINHTNIFESLIVRMILGNILRVNKTADPASSVVPDAPSVKVGEPSVTEQTSLVVSTHSPVELHIYDSHSNHTGLKPLDDPSLEPSLVTAYEENIPGSQFMMTGLGNDPETYISLPDNTGETYSIEVRGIDLGSATLKLERIAEQGSVESVEYILPVTPLMKATTVIMSGESDGTYLDIASSSPAVRLDIDGNGSIDATLDQGNAFDPLLNIRLIRKSVETLLGNTKVADKLDKRLARIEDLLQKGKLPQAKKTLEKLDDKIGTQLTHQVYSTLTAAQKKQIIDSIDLFVAQFE